MTSDPGRLNENQARRLRVTCQHIDRALSEIENTLSEASSQKAFPEHIPDLSPAQKKTIEDYIARIRARLIHVLEGQGVPVAEPHIPVSRAVRSRLYSIDIAAEELRPKYMAGYGGVPPALATDLDGIAGELQTLAAHLDRVLDSQSGQDFARRLRHLQDAGNDLDLLARNEQVVSRQGMVEFRGSIAAILDRAEDTSFEIAVFGRVSSGKSSLLNTMLRTDALPVGVTPVTAVPTRIIHGEEAGLTVSFADAPQKTCGISSLHEYATEQENPRNKKHVTRITVVLPAPRLKSGVSFVDTPGLGSLATSGAAETLAYLPRCDLGVLLVDAGSTLTETDVRTILALQEAAIPVRILLSKADLLSETDCERTITYMKQHILAETGLSLPVHPVSVRPSHESLLEHWFDREILPLYDRSRELRKESLQRKIGALTESVIGTLERKIRKNIRNDPDFPGPAQEIETRLRRATGRIAETKKACGKAAEAMAGNIPDLFMNAASRLGDLKVNGPAAAAQQEEKDRVRGAIHGAVQKRADTVRVMIEELAVSLQADLVQSAGEIDTGDMPAPDEFLTLVRGMPVFDFGNVPVPPGPSALMSLLGRQTAEEQMAQGLRRAIGTSLEPALAGYARILREWSEMVTARLAERFDTYAMRYRAQIESSRDVKEADPDERRAIEDDLALLRKR